MPGLSLSGTFRFLPRFVVHRSTEDVRDTVFFCISFIMRWCWFCHLHILLLFPFINVTSTCTHTETLLYSFRCCVFTKKQRIFFTLTSAAEPRYRTNLSMNYAVTLLFETEVPIWKNIWHFSVSLGIQNHLSLLLLEYFCFSFWINFIDGGFVTHKP